MQLNVKGPAEFISNRVLLPFTLCFPETLRRVIMRYAKILLAFTISGIMHVASDTGGAISARESGALSFSVCKRPESLWRI